MSVKTTEAESRTETQRARSEGTRRSVKDILHDVAITHSDDAWRCVVTPHIASELLEHLHTPRRGLRIGSVESLQRTILAGRWKFDGNFIPVSRSGILLGGTHRLTAISRCHNAACEIGFVFGIDEQAAITSNSCVPQRVWDTFQMWGIPNANRCAGVCRVALSYGRRQLSHNARSVLPEYGATAEEIHEVAVRFPSIHGVVSERVRIGAYNCASPVIFVRFGTNEADFAASQSFWEQVASGEGLREGSPILALRRGIEHVAATKRRASDYPSILIAAWVIKAWNSFKTGQSMRIASIRADEDFPEIRGFPPERIGI